MNASLRSDLLYFVKLTCAIPTTSCIEGEPAKFIASMGPLPAQLVPFWRMVWKSAIGTIVMTTGLKEKGKHKCAPYMPQSDKKGVNQMKFGSFTITCTKKTVYGTYTHSQFTFERMNQPKRKVDHFWFSAWPDHGVPMNGKSYNCDDVIDFLEMVNASRAKKKIMTPLLVHCSAGVGRTGTFIAMDHIMKTLHQGGKCDALAVINNIRQDRCLLVQHSLQYQWLCSAMVRYAQRQNRPYEVVAPPEAGAAKKAKKKAAKDLSALRAKEKEAAKAKNEAEVGEGQGMTRKSSLRRQSSIIGVLPTITYEGKAYDFAEGNTSGIMEWAVAEEQSMPRELYDAIAGDTSGLLEAASWTDFTVQHMDLDSEDSSTVTVTMDMVKDATSVAFAAAEEREKTADAAMAGPEDGDWYVGEMEHDAVVSMVMEASAGDFVIRKDGQKYIIYVNDKTKTLELLVDLSIEDVDVTTELEVDAVDKDEEFMFLGQSYTSLGAVVTALRGATIESEAREGETIAIGDPVPGGMSFEGALGEDTKETKKFARKMSKKHSFSGGARPSVKRAEDETPAAKKSTKKSKRAPRTGPAPSTEPWYVGAVSKSKCEKAILTEGAAVGTWLVRDGKSDGTYQIVAKDIGSSARTFLIKTTKAGKFLAFKEEYDSLDAAVEKFKAIELDSKDTEGEKFTLADPADSFGL